MLDERDELSPLSLSESAGCIIPSIVVDRNAHRYDVEIYQRIETLRPHQINYLFIILISSKIRRGGEAFIFIFYWFPWHLFRKLSL